MRVTTVYKVIGFIFPLAGLVYFYVAWTNLNFATPWFSLAFAFGGIIFIVVGLAFGLTPVLAERKKQRLMQSGVTAEAVFLSVEINWRIAINNQHPYYITAKGVDYLGKERLFKSQNIWANPAAFLTSGQKMKVYLDPNNPKKYWLDISFLGNQQ